MQITAHDLACRWIGTREVPGPQSNAFVLGMLQLELPSVHDDETPWCSAFVNFIAWQLGLPRSGSLAARSWLTVGTRVALNAAGGGFDVVVLWRGTPDGAHGHVGFYAGRNDTTGAVLVLGGNQGDAVSVAQFPAERVLGVRRLLEERR